jgi:Bacterial SH3 domain
MQQQFPPDGQFFVVPAAPRLKRVWGLPLIAGASSLLLLMVLYGFVEQQTATKPIAMPRPTSQASPPSAQEPVMPTMPYREIIPVAQAASQPLTPMPGVYQASFSPSQLFVPRIEAAPALHRIHCPPNLAANFRDAPTLHSQVIAVLVTGDPVELTGRRAKADGVPWTEIRHRGQYGWVASNFIGR